MRDLLRELVHNHDVDILSKLYAEPDGHDEPTLWFAGDTPHRAIVRLCDVGPEAWSLIMALLTVARRRIEPPAERDRSHVCVPECRPNAHIAFVGRRLADEAATATGAVIPSRSTDPDTSRKAEPTPVKAGTQRAHLLAAFGLEAAADGLTDEEAADLTQGAVPYRSEFAKRCSELRAAGLIAETGDTRPGVAGHQRIVSAITDAGRATLVGLS